MAAEPLGREALAVDALVAAGRLVGAHLVQGELVMRIVEVEAYRWPDDTACHARAGRTARNATMWGPAGHAYVYLCYGLHWMLNVVTDGPDAASAVLIRGVEVLAGHDVVAARRGRRLAPGVLAGPGKVGAALGLDARWDGHDLCAPGGLALHPGRPPLRWLAGPRVGIDYATPEHVAAPWRLADADSDQVSHRRALVAVPGVPTG